MQWLVSSTLEFLFALFSKTTVGYVDLEREEEAAVARQYYRKLPDLIELKRLCQLENLSVARELALPRFRPQFRDGLSLASAI